MKALFSLFLVATSAYGMEEIYGIIQLVPEMFGKAGEDAAILSRQFHREINHHDDVVHVIVSSDESDNWSKHHPRIVHFPKRIPLTLLTVSPDSRQLVPDDTVVRFDFKDKRLILTFRQSFDFY